MTKNTFLSETIEEWLQDPYDEATKQEIKHLIASNPEELQDAFFQDLSFGTGGLRAKMGVGTNRLNRYTIAKATQGLANYIKKKTPREPSVFIGYDVRKNSREFAEETARVLAANQIRVYLAHQICPTPLVSFACRELKCVAAVMITASHNPPEYNGYKVYWSDGGQIVAPHDQGIIEEVKKITNFSQVQKGSVDDLFIEEVGCSLDEAYLSALSQVKLYKDLPPIHIIYTPLHGTGIRIIPKALESWNFSCSLVEKQKNPDGQFTYAKSPNPEETETLELGANMLVEEKADLLLGTDPDADRVGAAVFHKGKAIYLTGNQIGCLCLDHICKALKKKNELSPKTAAIKTIVTTELFAKIAKSYGINCLDVLTGFKHIGAEIERLETNKEGFYLFGAEESYGYLFGSFVRDKDAISSSCLIAEAAALAKKEGITLLDRLYELYQKHGVHRESLTNISLAQSQEGLDSVQHMMDFLRKTPPIKIGGESVVQIEDYLAAQSQNILTQKLEPLSLPRSNVLRFWLQDRTKLTIRPSGTEPKIKIYIEVCREKSFDIEKMISFCESRLEQIIQDFKKILHLMN